MILGDLYAFVTSGMDCPEVAWIPSFIGPVMITKQGHFLCDDDGNVVGEVDKSYAEQWFKSMETQNEKSTKI